MPETENWHLEIPSANLLPTLYLQKETVVKAFSNNNLQKGESPHQNNELNSNKARLRLEISGEV